MHLYPQFPSPSTSSRWKSFCLYFIFSLILFKKNSLLTKPIFLIPCEFIICEFFNMILLFELWLGLKLIYELNSLFLSGFISFGLYIGSFFFILLLSSDFNPTSSKISLNLVISSFFLFIFIEYYRFSTENFTCFC